MSKNSTSSSLDLVKNLEGYDPPISSINGDNTSEQLITAGSGISVSTIGGNTTISGTGVVGPTTGSGAVVLQTTPTIITPVIGTIANGATNFSLTTNAGQAIGVTASNGALSLNSRANTLTLGTNTGTALSINASNQVLTNTGGASFIVQNTTGTSLSINASNLIALNVFNSNFTVGSTSGASQISVAGTTGNIALNTFSGNFTVGTTAGASQISVAGTTGNIVLNTFSGNFNVNTTAGTSQISVAGTTGNIVLNSKGGSLTLSNTAGTQFAISSAGAVSGSIVATAATASTLALRDANALLTSLGFIQGFTTQALAASTLTMTIASTPIQVFTGSTASQIVKLPTTGIVAGMQYQIKNLGTQSLALQSSGGNAVATVATLTSVWATALLATPTTAAGWTVI